MASKIKIGIVGCGRFSRCFVPLFKAHPFVESVSVCDLIPERAQNFSKQFNVGIIDSFEEMLESNDINAVAIFTQRYTHGPLVIKALEAGKNVYSSVPCAIKIEEIKRIEELVRKTRLTYSMGETGFYRAPTIYCREQFYKGNFGKFVFGEAQYNHDVRNMEQSFRSSEGENWKQYAGLPPMFYPTHSTAMILGAMPGVYATQVSGFGYREQNRTDIYGTEGQNVFNNPFSNTVMMMKLSNGGLARLCENRSLGWLAPETYISQFYGTEGCYEFSVAHHYQSHWDPDDYGKVKLKDVSQALMPPRIYEGLKTNYDSMIDEIGHCAGFTEVSPIQPVGRLPKSFSEIPNGHNGTHHFIIDDFCRAVETGKLSPTNIWQVARFMMPGLLAHESAMNGSQPITVPDIGNPPEDWELLNPDNFPIN